VNNPLTPAVDAAARALFVRWPDQENGAVRIWDDARSVAKCAIDAAAPIIAAETLREAADDLDGGRMGRVRVSYGYVAGWLRRRADELEENR